MTPFGTLLALQSIPAMSSFIQGIAKVAGGVKDFDPMGEITQARQEDDENKGKVNDLYSKLDKGELDLNSYNEQAGNIMGIQGGAGAAATGQSQYGNAGLEYRSKPTNFTEDTKNFIASGYYDPSMGQPGWYKNWDITNQGLNEMVGNATTTGSNMMQTALMSKMLGGSAGWRSLFR